VSGLTPKTFRGNRGSGKLSRMPETKKPAKRLWYRKKAIALLEKWSFEETPLDLFDQLLRHPGTIRALGGSDGFVFVGTSGTNAVIFPNLWHSVTVGRGLLTKEPDSIHIGESDRTYSLLLPYSLPEDGLQAAEALLANWCALELQELYVSTTDLPIWSFLGAIRKVADDTYTITMKDSSLKVTFSLAHKVCKVERYGDHTGLFVTDRMRGRSIFISETALSAVDLFQRFSSATRAIN
jgi:hypothetical protein